MYHAIDCSDFHIIHALFNPFILLFYHKMLPLEQIEYQLMIDYFIKIIKIILLAINRNGFSISKNFLFFSILRCISLKAGARQTARARYSRNLRFYGRNRSVRSEAALLQLCSVGSYPAGCFKFIRMYNPQMRVLLLVLPPAFIHLQKQRINQ